MGLEARRGSVIKLQPTNNSSLFDASKDNAEDTSPLACSEKQKETRCVEKLPLRSIGPTLHRRVDCDAAHAINLLKQKSTAGTPNYAMAHIHTCIERLLQGETRHRPPYLAHPPLGFRSEVEGYAAFGHP